MKGLVAILLSLLAVAVVVDMTRVDMVRTASIPPLPEPVTNNAVVAVTAEGREFLISFAGLGPGKGHDDTHAKTYVFDSAEDQWHEAASLPGGVGRLAATAVAVGELAYVFGGYTVAEDGSETSMRWVHAFDPVSGEFTERVSMPVPVDDAIAVVYEGRYVYLVSGWHDFGNVNLVQQYDTETDTWSQATPTPGRAVFGHAGGIVGNTIVYCDGVAIQAHEDRRRDFVANPECFAGIIDSEESRRIDWREIKPHPGKPRYRMAAASSTEEGGVIFIGGSENPYNYDGMGYDGSASSPAEDALLYKVVDGSWQQIDVSGPATMDHRGLMTNKSPTTLTPMHSTK
jgi:N-acetylneuraminic acid mutarotase